MSILKLAQQAIAKDRARAESKIRHSVKSNCARNRLKAREAKRSK